MHFAPAERGSGAQETGCFLVGGAPIGIEPVHERMEPRTVSGLQQMTHLVDHNVFDAPLGQEEEIGGKADGAGADETMSPFGFKGFAGDDLRPYTHDRRVTVNHGFYEGEEPTGRFLFLRPGLEG